ncbi:Glucose-6-phosphate 1-dehydrogenase [Conglomerata obtusa]
MKIIIFGASGDLSKRKLFPSLAQTEPSRIIAYSRSDLKKSFKQRLCESYAYSDEFLQRVEYVQGEYDDLSTLLSQYVTNNDVLDSETKNKINSSLQTEITKQTNEEKYNQVSIDNEETMLYYLSVPPSLYLTVINGLKSYKGIIAIEKPFARTCSDFNQIHRFTQENPQFKFKLIDHYLLKPICLCMGDIQRRIHLDDICSVLVMAKEELGIEGRSYFDDTGIVKDIVQNHLLSLYSQLFANLNNSAEGKKDIGKNNDGKNNVSKNIDSKNNVSKNNVSKNNVSKNSIDKNNDTDDNVSNNYSTNDNQKRQNVLCDTFLTGRSVIGQYREYCDELGHRSETETFALVEMFNERKKMKVILVSGKGLNEKRTEIRIRYKKEGFLKVINKLNQRGIYIDAESKEKNYDGIELLIEKESSEKNCNSKSSEDFSFKNTNNAHKTINDSSIETINYADKSNDANYVRVKLKDIKKIELVLNLAPRNEIYLNIEINGKTKEYIILKKDEIKEMVKRKYGILNDHALVFDCLIMGKEFPVTEIEEGKKEWELFDKLERKKMIYYEKGEEMPKEAEKILNEL